MATADQVKALVRSHGEGDDLQFDTVALQVAARAARQGHTKLATELRDSIEAAKSAAGEPKGRSLRPVPVVRLSGELAGLLTVSYSQVGSGVITGIGAAAWTSCRSDFGSSSRYYRRCCGEMPRCRVTSIGVRERRIYEAK